VSAPPIQYTHSDDLHIAYQVVGNGPRDVVLIPDWISNIELYWEEPHFVRIFRRLASFSRLILFDMRGTGGSDPIPQTALPTEEWMRDVEAVLDAVGSESASIVGMGNAGQMAMLFAATRPERVDSLVLYNSYARLTAAPDYPEGMDDAFQEVFLTDLERLWGTGRIAKLLGPSIADEPGLIDWWGKVERLTMSPGAAVVRAQLIFSLDVREVLPAIGVPTLVLHRSGNPLFPAAHARELRDRIPDARYVELPGTDHWPLGPEFPNELEEFLTGERASRAVDRVLATVLVTDIVGSTERAAALGDARWRRLMDRHDEATRRTISAFRGTYVKSTGDGLFATFDGPARAIECTREMRTTLSHLDLSMRAGLHTGEIEVLDGDIAGIAVNIAVRVSALAGTGEILVSRIVRDLAAGSDTSFSDRGEHALKGIPERSSLYAVN
jgi:class 3 adenylate cyclase/pimeloyl-ACP methyl ester carboxylesterase